MWLGRFEQRGKVTIKRVLVVGGAGYIGGWLTDKLIEAGNETRVYDLLLYEERFFKDVDFIAGDVLDHERLRPHLDWAEAVVWLAALVGDPGLHAESRRNPEDQR